MILTPRPIEAHRLNNVRRVASKIGLEVINRPGMPLYIQTADRPAFRGMILWRYVGDIDWRVWDSIPENLTVAP